MSRALAEIMGLAHDDNPLALIYGVGTRYTIFNRMIVVDGEEEIDTEGSVVVITESGPAAITTMMIDYPTALQWITDQVADEIRAEGR